MQVKCRLAHMSIFLEFLFVNFSRTIILHTQRRFLISDLPSDIDEVILRIIKLSSLCSKKIS